MMGSLPTATIQRVAIVGAGPGGVVAARYLGAERHFRKIDVFEQQDSLGGVWNHSRVDDGPRIPIPQVDPNSTVESPLWTIEADLDGSRRKKSTFVTPMYDRLETNIPHNLMRHSDASSLQEYQLFPTREEVLGYLSNYGKDVIDLVQFHTQVVDIRAVSRNALDFWRVTTRDLALETTRTEEYDAVLIASGHYSVPHVPDIKGIARWNEMNPGAIGHSKLYRSPDEYTGKKVIVVGNSASGIDICSQIATVAQQPVLMSQRSESSLAFKAAWKKDLPQIKEFLPPDQGTRAVQFTDGHEERDVDAVLFCTGYYYSYPYLSSIDRAFISTGERVQHLYRHMFSIDRPSLAFLGLPSKIIPFRTFESQAAVIARVWSDRLKLASRTEMQDWEDREVRDKGSGKSYHVLPFPKDFEYHNDLVDWASSAEQKARGMLPPKWTEKETWQRARFPAIKKAFAECGEQRHHVRTIEELGFDYDNAPPHE